MPTTEITETVVARAKTSGREMFIWDTALHGFGVRVTGAGTKTYVFQYRLGGREARTRRFTIGKHGSPWAVADAREKAEQLAQMVARKQDPMAIEVRRRRDSHDEQFVHYVDKFSKLYLEQRWKRHDQAKRTLLLHAVPRLGPLSIREIDRSDIVPIYDALANRPSVAYQLHAILRKMFRWAVSRGDLARSPLECFEAPCGARPRERYLRDVELAIVWRACRVLGASFSAIIQILILTGQRRGEVAGLSWGELDRDLRVWTLPATRSKNRREHSVHLASQCLAIIDELGGSKDWPGNGLIFAGDPSGGRMGFSKAKAILDREIARYLREGGRGFRTYFLEPWRLHDLRRSLATGMQRIGVRMEVIEAVLNHRTGTRAGLVAVYQRHEWREEMTVALNNWAAHVEKIVKDLAQHEVAAMGA